MIETYTLVMYIYAGMMARGDSVTLHSIPGFVSFKECMDEGKKGAKLVEGSFKEYRFICLKQGGIPK